MKKLLALVLLVALSVGFAREAVLGTPVLNQSQNIGEDIGSWSQSASNFAADSRGIRFMDMVDENVVWTAAYDGAGDRVNITEFGKTVDGGATWTTGSISAGSGGEIAMIKGINETVAYVRIRMI